MFKELKEIISYKKTWAAFMFMGFIFVDASFFTKSEAHLALGIYTLLYSIASWILNTFAGLGYVREKKVTGFVFHAFYAYMILLNIFLLTVYARLLLGLVK